MVHRKPIVRAYYWTLTENHAPEIQRYFFNHLAWSSKWEVSPTFGTLQLSLWWIDVGSSNLAHSRILRSCRAPYKNMAASAQLGICTTRFYRATRMHSADYAVARCLSVCLSVCLSHAGILFKRLHMFSKFFHRWIAPPFYFLHTKRYGKYSDGDPLTGALNARGYEKTIFDQYLALSRKSCKRDP